MKQSEENEIYKSNHENTDRPKAVRRQSKDLSRSQVLVGPDHVHAGHIVDLRVVILVPLIRGGGGGGGAGIF